MSDEREIKHWLDELDGGIQRGEDQPTSGADDEVGGQSNKGLQFDPSIGDEFDPNSNNKRNHPDDRRERGAKGTLDDKDEYTWDFEFDGRRERVGDPKQFRDTPDNKGKERFRLDE